MFLDIDNGWTDSYCCKELQILGGLYICRDLNNMHDLLLEIDLSQKFSYRHQYTYRVALGIQILLVRR